MNRVIYYLIYMKEKDIEEARKLMDKASDLLKEIEEDNPHYLNELRLDCS